jgi:pseudouridine synthase
MKERLQKALAHAGVASRRAAEDLIREGRVEVNGKIVTKLGTSVDAAVDTIRVDGKPLRKPAVEVYLMLHKPRGYVTTLRDPEGRPTVLDLLPSRGARVFPVGRLDYQTEGLLLLTNDGELAAQLMHPRHGVEKTYLAKVRGNPESAELKRLADGIVLDGRRTLPARARVIRRAPNAWLQLGIREGRKHQVRRMLAAIGHPVMKLRRVGYGGLTLGRLPVGSYRSLSAAELATLRRAAREVAAPAPRPRPSGKQPRTA